jgi:hypothetical protein
MRAKLTHQAVSMRPVSRYAVPMPMSTAIAISEETSYSAGFWERCCLMWFANSNACRALALCAQVLFPQQEVFHFQQIKLLKM